MAWSHRSAGWRAANLNTSSVRERRWSTPSLKLKPLLQRLVAPTEEPTWSMTGGVGGRAARDLVARLEGLVGRATFFEAVAVVAGVAFLFLLGSPPGVIEEVG